MGTLFKKIIDRELPADIVYEDELCMAFKDIHPQAPIHLLVIPKKEIPSLANISDEDKMLIGHIMLKVADIAQSAGLEKNGYRVITNIGTHGGQVVPHLHFHILGGERLGPLNSSMNSL
ncbi:MAG: histidine triad nucleotide-binding protein [Bdellovibrionales bacterium]|nr:histidine triad nucleotide-binding protein [Bdellovibrionales bacterium]